eukprot:TRINITY_DN2916_c0_g1_i2.p1 TRINITY_DN2916_c0_g1~~TRINITY_DN2916_c0_g1_i2.p1  ORF type:complete len:256 (-),score=61.24 TRINITY_DN2916_c0_g1_i2:62-829(-)
MLLRAEEDQAPRGFFRFIRSCSSPLAPTTLHTLEERFGSPVLEAYGMTEASHQMASNPLPNYGVRKAGTVGVPTNVEIAIFDDKGVKLPSNAIGEICIRGNNVTPGYHNNPDANRANFFGEGWFRTGDQGKLDSDGYLSLTGRMKEIINRGGEKISPIELDDILLQHPAVAEAVCFAAPDTKYGEVPMAVVVPKAGKTVTEADIVAFCKTRMTAFKVPTRVFIDKDMPRTATGKIQRRIVAAHFLEKLKQPQSKL